MDNLDLTNQKEIKRQLELVKLFLLQISQGYNLDRHQDLFIFLNQQQQNEQLRKYSYLLLKSIKCDQSLLQQIIVQNLQNESDSEVYYSIQLLQLLDYQQSVDLIKNNQNDLLKLTQLESTKIQYYQAVLQNIFNFLLCSYFRSFINDNNDLREQIIYMISKILENIHSKSKDVKKYHLEIFINLMDIYIYQDVQFLNHLYFSVPQNQIRHCLNPLVSKLINKQIKSIMNIHNTILQYELRTQCYLIKFTINILIMIQILFKFQNINADVSKIKLIQQDSQIIKIKEFQTNLLEIVIDRHLKVSTEFEMIQNSCQNIFMLLQKVNHSFLNLRSVYEHLIMIFRLKYKSEYNQILLNLAVNVDVLEFKQRIQYSYKMLEIIYSQPVNNQSTRTQLGFQIFQDLFECNYKNISNKNNSVLINIFNMEWFFKLLKNKAYNYLREEIVCIMAISLGKYRKSGLYESVLLDVLDICYRLINWNDLNQMNQHSLEIFMILVQESLRIKNNIYIKELFKKINQYELKFNIIYHLLVLIHKYIGCPQIQQDLEFKDTIKNMKDEINVQYLFFQSDYVSQQQNLNQLIIYQDKIKKFFHILYLYSKFDVFFEYCSEIANQYVEFIEQILKMNNSFNKLAISVQEFSLKMKVNIETKMEIEIEKYIYENQFIYLLDYQDHDFYRNYYFYNDLRKNLLVSYVQQKFNQKYFMNDLIENQNVISNLLKNSEFNSQFGKESEQQQITGCLDILQIYCSHQINFKDQVMIFRLQVMNLSKIRMENIRLKILLQDGLVVGDSSNSQFIDEIPSNQYQNINFYIKITQSNFFKIQFEIEIENEGQNYQINSRKYEIDINEFLFDIEIDEESEVYYENQKNMLEYELNVENRSGLESGNRLMIGLEGYMLFIDVRDDQIQIKSQNYYILRQIAKQTEWLDNL